MYMNYHYKSTFLTLICSLLLHVSLAQYPTTGELIGRCEGCEAVFEYGDRTISSTDTLPGFNMDGSKIKVSGTVYGPDGTTPAADVILYLYHTDQNGVYPTRGDEEGWERRHGFIREWIKTDDNGKYEFYTLKPAVYPNRTEPAHIHITVLEPDGKYYWLNSYHFEGDELLTEKELNDEKPRGGSKGILSLEMKNGILTGRRDIILGRNIPGYK